MTSKLNRGAYEDLIAGDLAWLATTPRTLEREHVRVIVEASVAHEYPAEDLRAALAASEAAREKAEARADEGWNEVEEVIHKRAGLAEKLAAAERDIEASRSVGHLSELTRRAVSAEAERDAAVARAQVHEAAWRGSDRQATEAIASAAAMREASAALVDSLPKCDECDKPATRAYTRGAHRWCGDHGSPSSTRFNDPPDYPRAAPLRRLVAMLATDDAGAELLKRLKRLAKARDEAEASFTIVCEKRHANWKEVVTLGAELAAAREALRYAEGHQGDWCCRGWRVTSKGDRPEPSSKHDEGCWLLAALSDGGAAPGGREPASTDVLAEPLDQATAIAALRGWSNQMASRYGYPVWLVGSALNAANMRDARDFDVRIVLTDSDFAARFDVDVNAWCREQWSSWGEGSKRWGVEMAKIAKQWMRTFASLRLNLDFQVHPACVGYGFISEPRVRLDDLPLVEDDTPLARVRVAGPDGEVTYVVPRVDAAPAPLDEAALAELERGWSRLTPGDLRSLLAEVRASRARGSR